MVGVEPSGQRPEGGKDDLPIRDHEAAPRHPAALEVDPKLGMEMAGHLGPLLVLHGLVAEDDPAELDLVGDSAAAMVGEARVMVADDPGPIELRGERQ